MGLEITHKYGGIRPASLPIDSNHEVTQGECSKGLKEVGLEITHKNGGIRPASLTIDSNPKCNTSSEVVCHHWSSSSLQQKNRRESDQWRSQVLTKLTLAAPRNGVAPAEQEL